jgi:hypothetical protein
VVKGDPLTLTNAAARAAYPNLPQDVAFSKFVAEHAVVLNKYVFERPDPYSYLQSEPLRKTTQLQDQPQASMTPSYTGGEEGNRTRSSARRTPDKHSIGNVGDDAYQQLVALTNQQLKERGLSTEHFAREFARLYTSPGAAQLAQAERVQNRPAGVQRLATG